VTPLPGFRLLAFLALAALLTACEPRRGLPEVSARAETAPVPSSDDAADDPAIWVHPGDASASRVLGTNKQSGLHVYDLDGAELQHLPVGRLNNVDLRQGVPWAGAHLDLAAATNRTDQTITLFRIEADGRAVHLARDAIASGLTEPYGLCLYFAPREETLYLFANDKDGRYRQWRLTPAEADPERVAAELLREFRLDSQPEGCVVDDARAVLYLGEENQGLWRASADPQAPFEPRLLDRTGDGRLVADVEGMSLYDDGQRHLLLVSSQGDDSFAVYDTNAGDRYLGSFRIGDGSGDPPVDGVQETDGLDTVAGPLGEQFPAGLLVVQDGDNRPRGENQNFKLVSMAEVLALLEPSSP
jgi:3-phytase